MTIKKVKLHDTTVPEDILHPETEATMVKMADGDTVENKVMTHEADYAKLKAKTYDDYIFDVTAVDADGKPTETRYKRADTTLYLKVNASNADANGNYQTIVETYHLEDGTTVDYVVTWTVTYDANSIITHKSWVVS
jgi:hypothetical protein